MGEGKIAHMAAPHEETASSGAQKVGEPGDERNCHCYSRTELLKNTNFATPLPTTFGNCH